MPRSRNAEAICTNRWLALYGKNNSAVAYGANYSTAQTQGAQGDGVPLFDVLQAVD